MNLIHFLHGLMAALVCVQVIAAESSPIVELAEHYARTNATSPEAQVAAGKLDVSRLPACESLEPFAPAGTRFSGRVYVGIRCLRPKQWQILVPVQISIVGRFASTTRALAAGHVLGAEDIVLVNGDIGQFPAGVIQDPKVAIGKTIKNSMGAGQALRSDLLLAPFVVRQGQNVRVTSKGAGFSVTAEGKALNNASEGQVVQVKMLSGQTVSGIAQADGGILLSF